MEQGSAGSLPATANVTTGAGPLDLIAGNLLDATEVDMYLIWIADYLSFSATTEEGLFSVNDPQLFLFDSAGLAVYMNDDGDGLGSQSQLPVGDPFGPAANGLYYLAIGWFDNEPFSAAGRMFTDDPGTNGPDVGGSSPVTSWNEDVLQRLDLPTAYSIRLTGAEHSGLTSVPEPSSAFLMLLGSSVLLVGRRRNSGAR